MSQERELSVSFESLVQTEQALKRMEFLESNAKVGICQELLSVSSDILACFAG